MSVLTRMERWWKRHVSEGPPLEFVPGGWPDTPPETTSGGWNSPSVVALQAAALVHWQRPLAGPDPLGTGLAGPGEALNLHNTQITFAYVAALAARDVARFSLLDWGGGVGQYGWIARAALPEVSVDYYCKDVPVQSDAGRTVFPGGTFYTSDDQFAGRTFHLVMASGSLHYVADWRAALHRLAAATDRYLFVTRLPVVAEVQSYVTRQRAYRTQYFGWTLNREEFLAASQEAGLILQREFLLGESHRAHGAPEASHSRGFLFRPASRSTRPALHAGASFEEHPHGCRNG